MRGSTPKIDPHILGLYYYGPMTPRGMRGESKTRVTPLIEERSKRFRERIC